jgi:hypothetical protein
MRKILAGMAALMRASFSAYAQDASNTHVHHLMEPNTLAPPGQDWAKARADKSPRRLTHSV